MSENNVLQFARHASGDPALSAAIEQLPKTNVDQLAADLSRLSQESPYPFTKAEYLVLAGEMSDASVLDDRELEKVAGGVDMTDLKNAVKGVGDFFRKIFPSSPVHEQGFGRMPGYNSEREREGRSG